MMYKSSKGQAALEFMMTYGWAILVVLAAIGALSYFGVLNPSRFTPDTCLASAGFACPGKPIMGGSATVQNSGTIAFSVVNGLGYQITLDTTKIAFKTLTNCNVIMCDQGFTSGASCTNSTITTKAVNDGSGITAYLTACDFSKVQVVKGEVLFNYTNTQSGLVETLIVSVTGKAK